MSDDVKWIQDRHRVLSGKRRAPRRRRTLSVRLLGPGGVKYAARTVDVSRGGMLAEITDTDFLPIGDRADLLPFAARVATVFPQGMDVFFGDGAVQVHADVVRLVTRPGDSVLLLGCRFQPELSDFDCRLLGVETAGDETDVAPLPEETTPALGSVPAARPTPTGGNGRPIEPAPLAPTTPIQLDGSAPATVPAPTAAAPKGAGFRLADDSAARARRISPAPPPPAVPARAGSAPLTMPPAGAPPPKPAAAPALAPAPAPVAVPAPAPAAVPQIAFAPVPGVGADSRATSLRLAGPGVVVAHLFPMCGTLFGYGSRYAARVVDVDDRRVVLEVAVPEGEPDPLAYAAGLGADTRAVVVQDGRVLWETRVVVERVAEAGTRDLVRVEGRAVRPPTTLVRRAFQPAAA